MPLSKEQLESKWWHRLTKVIIIFLTIASFVCSFILFILEDFSQTKFILSFEEDYSKINKEERNLEDIGDFSFFVSPYYVINTIKFLDPPANKPSGSFKPFSAKEIIELYEKGNLYLSNSDSEKILGEVVKNYPNWKIKAWKEYDYLLLLIFLIVPITYFGLWLVYKKVVLYIVFGKKQIHEGKN